MEAHKSYFPPLRHVAAWHRAWRWQRVSQRLPDAVKSSPNAVNTYLERVRPLLEAQGLWPFPATAPRLPTPSTFGAHDWEATPLQRAAVEDDVDALQQALDAGAELDAQDDRGMTALMHAAHGGHLRAVTWLLQRGADARVEDMSGLGALCYACREGHLPVAAALMRHCGRALELEVVDAKILPWAASKLSAEELSEEPALADDAQGAARPTDAQEFFGMVLALPDVKVEVHGVQAGGAGGGGLGWPALTWAARLDASSAVQALVARHR